MYEAVSENLATFYMIVNLYSFILKKKSIYSFSFLFNWDISLSMTISLRLKNHTPIHLSLGLFIHCSIYLTTHPSMHFSPQASLISLTSFSSKVECLLCSVGPLEGRIISLSHTARQSHCTSLSHCLVWSHWLERVFIIICGTKKHNSIVSSSSSSYIHHYILRLKAGKRLAV